MSQPPPSRRRAPEPYREPVARATVADARVLPVLPTDAIRLAFAYWPGLLG